MNKVAFFVQGSQEIGYGHIFRCIRLAKLLKKKYRLVFFSFNRTAVNLIKKNKFDAFYIKDINKIKNYNCVIIDKLNNNKNFLKKISRLNKKLVTIDDKNIFKLDNLRKLNFLYFPKKYEKNKIINNFKYHIPLENFINNKFNKKIKKILIIQGGSDPYKNLNKIYQNIKKLISSEQKIIFHFHLGIRKKNDNVMKFFIKRKKMHKNLYFSHNIQNISKIIKNSDLAITACGTSALDLIYSKVPSIYATNENKELHTAKIFDKLGLGIYYGKIKNNKKNKLIYCLNFLISDYKKRLRVYRVMNKFNFKNSKKYFLKLI